MKAAWLVAVVQGHAVLAVKCRKSSGAARHLATVHSLHPQPGTIYLPLCGTFI